MSSHVLNLSDIGLAISVLAAERDRLETKRHQFQKLRLNAAQHELEYQEKLHAAERGLALLKIAKAEAGFKESGYGRR